MGFNDILKKLFGNKSQRDLREIQPYVTGFWPNMQKSNLWTTTNCVAELPTYGNRYKKALPRKKHVSPKSRTT